MPWWVGRCWLWPGVGQGLPSAVGSERPPELPQNRLWGAGLGRLGPGEAPHTRALGSHKGLSSPPTRPLTQCPGQEAASEGWAWAAGWGLSFPRALSSLWKEQGDGAHLSCRACSPPPGTLPVVNPADRPLHRGCGQPRAGRAVSKDRALPCRPRLHGPPEQGKDTMAGSLRPGRALGPGPGGSRGQRPAVWEGGRVEGGRVPERERPCPPSSSRGHRSPGSGAS